MRCNPQSVATANALLCLMCAAVLVAAAGCSSSTGYGRRGVVVLPPRGAPAPDAPRPAMMAPAPASSAPAAGPAMGTARPAGTSAQARPSVSGAGMPAPKAPTTAYRLKPGDPLIVYLRGIPGQEQQLEDIVDESGSINMPFINAVQAGGRTPTELEQAIRKAYLDQQIYKYITVNVVVPTRSYFLKGEVKQPGRFPLMSGITIVQAIAGAGGFSEFADRGNVEVIRGTRRFRVNVRELEQHPERDREVEAGDVITVQRSFF